MEIAERPLVRRRRHSDQFKAELIAACRQPGVSVASVAMTHQVNANLLRRWMVAVDRRGDTASGAKAPGGGFVQLAIAKSSEQLDSVRIEVQRGATTVRVDWPASTISASGTWIRELLR